MISGQWFQRKTKKVYDDDDGHRVIARVTLTP